MNGRLGGALGIAAFLSQHAIAQEVALQGEVQVFEPSYFARYSPNTAQDMVNQVPGFSVQEGDAVRGFGGAAGNVLINGERPSTKTSLGSLLGRIPAASVIRIELVTGQSATLDMRGQTKVVNVIVREDALSQPITFDFLVRGTQDGRIQGQVQASTQREFLGGQINLSGTVNTTANNGPGGGAFVNSGRERYDGGGVSTEHGTGFGKGQPLIGSLNFEFERDMDWGAIRLNGGGSLIDIDNDRYLELYTPNSSGPLTGLEITDTSLKEKNFNLGGDVERRFAEAMSAKIITFNRRGWIDNSTEFSTFTGAGGLVLATTSAPEAEYGESILRGQVNWKLSKSHSIEIAAETAYNFLDSITGFTRETPTSTTTFFVDGSDTRVEEYRNEFQISDVWTVSPSITIEPGFKFEMSRIEQDIDYQTRPDLHAEREFEYPKPSITGSWRINSQQQVRVSYEREVAQLSFNDFVSSVELASNLTTGGNADLVPERTWAFNAEFEQRFWKGGVLTLFGSYDEVEDVQDFVVILIDHDSNPATPDIPVDAPGNIGDGTRFSAGFRAAVPLDNLGIAGARLDLSLAAGGSEVIDPITMQPREFSDEFKENWSISYRQDFPQQKWSYGFRLNDGGPSTGYRLNETSRRSRDDMDFGAWAETSAFFGLRIRAGFDDLFAADFTRVRDIFTGLREITPLSRSENSHSSNGVQPYIRISGKF
jgi:hypothetical protein